MNDSSYHKDPAKAHDRRWVHRPRLDDEKWKRRMDGGTFKGCIYQGLKKQAALRKGCPAFAGQEMQVIDMVNRHVLSYVRSHAGDRALVFANFSEKDQQIPANVLRVCGLGYAFRSLSDEVSCQSEYKILEPIQFLELENTIDPA